MNSNREEQLEGAQLVLFSHNRNDTAFIRRVESLQAAGAKVCSFSFRRDGERNKDADFCWRNIDLGYVEHAQFYKRLLLYFKAACTLFANRHLLQKADVVHGRNLDIFLLAWLAVTLSAPISLYTRKRMVYECLDVHEALTRDTHTARLLRWLERRALARCALLIVSSPGFITQYFEPLQNYQGEHLWIENKLYLGGETVARTNVGASNSESRIVIAWVGIIRCQQTLNLLCAVAASLPTEVVVRIKGLVSYFLLPEFDQQVAAHDNVVFEGRYDWPDGLQSAYSGADLVWAQELSWSGKNSDWLIPNRVYEASYFGVPSLAIAGTQTAKFIEDNSLGYTLPNASKESLLEFLTKADKGALRAKRQKLLEHSASEFVTTKQLAADHLQAILGSTDAEQAARALGGGT